LASQPYLNNIRLLFPEKRCHGKKLRQLLDDMRVKV
jgi:hypothetical protein